MRREREGLPSTLMREKQPGSQLPSVGGSRAYVGNPWLPSSPSVHAFLERLHAVALGKSHPPRTR